MLIRVVSLCLIFAFAASYQTTSPVLDNEWSKLGPGKRLADGKPRAKLTPYIKDGVLLDAKYPDKQKPLILEKDSVSIPYYLPEFEMTKYLSYKYKVVRVDDLILLELTNRYGRTYLWCESPSEALIKMSEPFSAPINVNGHKLGEKIDPANFVEVSDLYAKRWDKGVFYSPVYDPSLRLRTISGIIYTIEKLVFTDKTYAEWAQLISYRTGIDPELANLDGTEATNYQKWQKPGLFVSLSNTSNEGPIAMAKAELDKGTDATREGYLRLLKDFPEQSYKLTYFSSGLESFLTWWKVLNETGSR